MFKFKISNWKYKVKSLQKGQLLVELILVMGLMALLLPALLTAFSASREGKAQQAQRQSATALLKETEVAVKAIKNNNWTTITGATVGSPYYPAISGTSTWTLTAGTETVNGFTRQVVINNVQRDTNGAIVASGGTVDPSTKQIVATISWTEPSASSLTSTLYFTRSENMTYTETTETAFDAGTQTGTSVVETLGSGVTDDGEIQLSTGGGGGNWCEPELDVNTLDLPKNGVATGISATLGNAYVGTGENSSGVSFAKVNVSVADPPVPSLASTFDGYKTNGVFGETNYGYLSTDSNSKHVVIMDLNSVVGGKYTEVGYFDANTSNDATSVFVSGNIGYVTVGSTLRTFNLSAKTGSRAQLASVNLAGTGNKVIVSGNYAYVATSGSSGELQIIEVSNGGATLTVRGTVNVNGGEGRDVYVNSTATRAYLATAASASQREMHIINIETKSAPTIVGSGYESNGMSPNGVTLVPGNIAILVGSSGEQYQVISIANESSPARCGGLTVGATVNGIQSVLDANNNAFSYIIVAADPEFRIVQGGDGGTFTTTGIYESATYDATYSVSYNRFVATVNQPSQTTLRMQVGVAAPSAGVCPSSSSAYTFVGPNGSTSNYFTPSGGTITGAIPYGSYSPYYINPERCFRYKAFFDTSDITQTPVLYDMIINRSP